MSIFSWLGLTQAADQIASNSTATRGVVSPWAGPSGLNTIVVNDLLGVDTQTVTRAQAMSVPAVAKARHLICETLARQPLKAYKGGVEVPVQPSWLYRTDTAIGPRLRAMWILDDLLFFGWSLVSTKRGADGSILDAARVPMERWKFDTNGQVLVDNKPAPAEEVVLIPGPFEGLLTAAARTIRGAIALEDQWSARVKNPIPIVEISYTGDETLTDTEMRDIRDRYIQARQDVNGVVMVTPNGLSVIAQGDAGLNLFVEGRNNAALDIARFTNIPAILLDASNISSSSINYANTGVKRNEFHDYTLRSWALPLEERLSLDDISTRGTSIAFDLSALTDFPDKGIGPTVED